MSVHVCKQCGSKFEYCRACVFRPIRYKDLGFCSKECYEESKKEVIPAEDVEVVVINEEDTSTPQEEAIGCPYFFTDTVDQSTISVRQRKKKKRHHTTAEDLKENDVNED